MILSLIIIMIASLACILAIWWIYKYANTDAAMKGMFILILILFIILFWLEREGLLLF